MQCRYASTRHIYTLVLKRLQLQQPQLQQFLNPKHNFASSSSSSFDRHGNYNRRQSRSRSPMPLKNRQSSIPSIPIPSSSHEKDDVEKLNDKTPIRVSSLYNSLIRAPSSPQSTHRKRKQNNIINNYGNNLSEASDASTSNESNQTYVVIGKKKISTDETKRTLRTLTDCIRNGEGIKAFNIIKALENDGFVPSCQAIIMTIDACVAQGQLQYGDDVLKILKRSRYNHTDLNEEEKLDQIQGYHTARNILAIAYTTQGAYDEAASIIGFPKNYRELFASNLSKEDMENVLSNCDLGKDSVAWGIVIKILTKINQPFQAITVVDIAMQLNIHMTDSLLHLTIDALRLCGKWKEALWLFNKAVEKGIHHPHERTLASILLALSSKHARKTVELDEISRIIQMATNPSRKFLSVALMSLSSVGGVEDAEQIFSEICRLSTYPSEKNVNVDEFTYGCMMATYMNYLERFVNNNEQVNDNNIKEIHEDINQRSDELWKDYLQSYRFVRPSGMKRAERDGLLGTYLRIKTRCLENQRAITTLESISGNKDLFPYQDIRLYHITAVMGAVELSCDVQSLNKLLEIMKQCNLKHDMRSLAFTVGTLVGDGDLTSALDLIRKEIPQILSPHSTSEDYYKQYYPALLLRRMKLLASAYVDIGVGRIKDLDAAIQELEQHRTSANLSSRRLVFADYQNN